MLVLSMDSVDTRVLIRGAYQDDFHPSCHAFPEPEASTLRLTLLDPCNMDECLYYP